LRGFVGDGISAKNLPDIFADNNRVGAENLPDLSQAVPSRPLGDHAPEEDHRQKYENREGAKQLPEGA
jgi:hypothetical protein